MKTELKDMTWHCRATKLSVSEVSDIIYIEM